MATKVTVPVTFEVSVEAVAQGVEPQETAGTLSPSAVTSTTAEEKVSKSKSAVDGERVAKIIKLDGTTGDGADATTHFVLGIVLEPDPEGGDTQGDTYSAEEVKQAAYGFLKNAQVIGYMHKDVATGVAIVESFIQRGATTINEVAVKDGSWMLGVEITNPDLWTQIESGEINAFSIGGEATETQLE